MSFKQIGSIRRTQMISTYGVGSMVPLEEESFIVMGLDMWLKGPRVPEARLEQNLGVELIAPPAGENAPTIPVQRFPRWYSCVSCGYLGTFSGIQFDGECKACNRDAKFIPSRFIVACEHGHLQDFPYSRWVHGNRKPTDGCRLFLTFSGASASLRDIVVTCKSCGISRTLDGIFDAGEISKVAPRCLGLSPWLKKGEDASCDQKLRTLQRGASNVWFPDTRSALSIPPWSEEAMLIATRAWSYLPPDHPDQWGSILRTQATTTVSVEELVQATAHIKRKEEGERPSMEGLRIEEYKALERGTDGEGAGNEFVASVESVPTELSGHFEALVLAHRLREVRVLVGFSRLNSPPAAGQSSDALAPLCRDEVGWLPAIEVRGEGVFLTLNKERLKSWEQRADVKARASILQRNVSIAHGAYGGSGEPREVTPRILLLHSLAHALIDSLSLDAGYPASSLRERLYASDEMSGLLIYTASSDSAGSLGGVVRQAGPKQIERLVRDAIERSSWCSADPVCSESDPHGVDGLNLAACHNCLLLPETSCEERNTLLDRAMLVGSPADRTLGYFSDWI